MEEKFVPEKIAARTASQKTFHKISKIFRVLWIALVFALILMSKEIFNYREYALRIGAPYYDYKHIGYGILIAILIFFIRNATAPHMAKMIEPILAKKYIGLARDSEVQLMVKWAYDIIFYTCTTIAGGAILYKTRFDPIHTGNWWATMDRYPWTEGLPYMEAYYWVQIGHNLFSLADQALFKREEKNFQEMILHHIISTALGVFTYQMNILAGGVQTWTIHDIGDVFLCCLRFGANLKTQNNVILGILLAISILYWFVIRLIVFPYLIIGSIVNSYMTRTPEVFEVVRNGLLIQIIMLCILVPLNVYWLFLLSRKGYLQATKRLCAGRKSGHAKKVE